MTAGGTQLPRLLVLVHCYSLVSAHLRHRATLLTEGDRSYEPIITGCLTECGFADQSCATQCQVCVEKHACTGVKDDTCRICLREARRGRLSLKNKNSLAVDSGGSSLVHEGIRARLEVAHLDALRHKRLLRQLQGGILKFQRQAEWAAEERLNQRKKLHEAKLVLKHAEGEVAGWELRSARKLKATRSNARELRTELLKAEAELDEAKEKVRKERLALKRAKAREERSAALKRIQQAKMNVRKIRNVAADRRRLAELVEAKLEREEQDANWLGGGLDKKRKLAQEVLDQAIDRLHAARGMERFARERLEKAKRRYRKAAVDREILSEEVAQLEADFTVTPMQQAASPRAASSSSSNEEQL